MYYQFINTTTMTDEAKKVDAADEKKAVDVPKKFEKIVKEIEEMIV